METKHGKGQLIPASSKGLNYSGRVDWTNPEDPVFTFPSTSVSFKFVGSELALELTNYRAYWKTYIGYIIDGKQGVLPVKGNGKRLVLEVAKGLDSGEHEVIIFKRMDACHRFILHGFLISREGSLCQAEVSPYFSKKRRMTFYGDSVTAGEVSEALDYVGKDDPVHEGEYSNSWYSYAAMTARILKADFHNIAQGGIALMDGTGWYDGPNYTGLESIYDCCQYGPGLDTKVPWEFDRYRPNVVIIAIGQNDANPVNIMKEDYMSCESVLWRRRYQKFVEKIRGHNPKALIVLITTLLHHDESWDRAIDQVALDIKDDRVVRYKFQRNGCGTPGHLRITEAKEMALELSCFIESFGENIWDYVED